MSEEDIITVSSIRELRELVNALEDGVMISVAFEEQAEEEEDDGWILQGWA